MAFTCGREQIIAPGKARLESIDDFAAYFVATRAGGWSNRDPDIRRARVILPNDSIQSMGSNRRERATPAGMDRGKGARAWIANQDRHAVCGLNRQKNIRSIANQSIAAIIVAGCIRPRLGSLRVFDRANVPAVYLPATCQRPFACEKLEKPAAIVQNVLR